MDEIEGLGGGGVAHHVVATDRQGPLGPWQGAEVEVGGQHMTREPDGGHEVTEESPASGTNFPAPPSLSQASRLEHGHRPRVEELAEQLVTTSDWIGRAGEEVARWRGAHDCTVAMRSRNVAPLDPDE